MKTTKKRSERQGVLSVKAIYGDCKNKAGNLADERLQLVIQDIRQIDSIGTVKWFQPWALACLLAGARSGASIGEPMTFKFLNCSGIRCTAQSMLTPEANIAVGFDPDTQFEDAILAGLTFLEAPQTGGYRVVVDNTTYGVDGNWVKNRANVLYAADVIAYNFRQALESIYIGHKNTITTAEVSATAASILDTFMGQGLTVATGDAPKGYKNLFVKLVEGIDFILADITLQRAIS
jgi:hypothetical protein